MNTKRLRKGELRKINWDHLVKDLIGNKEKYHQHFYKNNQFNGPSLHFHLRALKANEFDKPELTYALLVSWGMHRMGGGAQMNDFLIFKNSIISILDKVKLLENSTLENITEKEMETVIDIFNNLKPMRTSKKIVGVSKVMAHYLPNIIAPIDNEYTFQFIGEIPKQKNPPRNWEESDLFKEIHLNLYKQVISDKGFKSSAKKWMVNNEFPWDTSLLKIVDNLIIGKIGDLKRTDPMYKRIKKNR